MTWVKSVAVIVLMAVLVLLAPLVELLLLKVAEFVFLGSEDNLYIVAALVLLIATFFVEKRR